MPVLKNARHERFAQEVARGRSGLDAATLAGYPVKRCSQGLKEFYVYALCSPTNGEVFYIGKGKGLRYGAHEREWKRGSLRNARKSKWFDSFAGQEVIALCLEDGLSEPAAYAEERRLIRAIGFDRLSNTLPGQFNVHERTIQDAEIWLARIKPFERWIAERERTPFEVEMYGKVVQGFRDLIEISTEMMAGAPYAKMVSYVSSV